MKYNILLLLVIFAFLGGCDRPTRTINSSANTSDSEYSNRNKRSDRKVINTPRTSNDKKEKPSSKQAEQEKKTIEVTGDKSVAYLFKSLEKGVFVVWSVLGEEKLTQGSGFFIASGIGITNYHVLAGGNEWYIQFNENYYEITDVLASSPPDELDYVIFRTDYIDNSILKVSKQIPDIGEDVFAIGTPKGLSNSLTKGTISGFRENNRIQIDATIDHGSSGGPLFNLEGEVIGITTSGIGTGSELNFAINIQSLPYKKYTR